MRHAVAQTASAWRHAQARRGPRGHSLARRTGFTLAEAMLAMVIVGTGVLASLQLFATCTTENMMASKGTTARTLADNIRECMESMAFCDPVGGANVWGPEPGETLSSYDDVDDFDGPGPAYKGTTLNPPIDATRTAIPLLSAYTQVVTVMPVDPNDPGMNENESSPTLPKGAYTGAVRVRVKVYYKQTPTSPSQLVYTTSWVRTNN
jgi:hypothetical protein